MKRFFTKVKFYLYNADLRIKLSLIGVIVGLTSGFASLFLNFGLIHLSEFFESFSKDYAYLQVFLPVIGLISTVIFLKYIIKDYGGHGLPEVIHSISLKGGNIKLRSSVSKLIGSLFTISFGGSAGPEAPVVVSGSSIGSNIARIFKSDEKVKIAVTGSGAAAAIAAIFNAPLAGIIFTMEVIIGEWTPIYMLPVAIASVTGTELSRIFKGNQIPFTHRAFDISTTDIFATIILSILCVTVAIVFIKSLRNIAQFMDTKFTNPFTKASLGGIIVGILIFIMPQVKGEGYELIKELISGKAEFAIFSVVAILLLKIFATSLTLGSGGAGGVFAPGLVLGSLTGYFFALLVQSMFPGLPVNDSSFFALVGMSGVLSGILQAPLTGIFLIIEITSGYDAILPLLIVSFLTPALVKLFEKHSIYHYELVKKGYLQRPRTDGKILSDIKTIELLEKNLQTVYPEMVLSDLIPIIKKSTRNYFPVIDKNTNSFIGMVYFNDIKEFIFNNEIASSILVEEVMHTGITTVDINDTLLDIQEKFEKTNSWSLPVVHEGKFQGLISKASMLDLYRKELKVQTES